jgi:hypothetical protein
MSRLKPTRRAGSVSLRRVPIVLALLAATSAGALAQPAGSPAYDKREAAVVRAEAGRTLGQAQGNNHGQVVVGALRARGRDEATLAALREAGSSAGRNGVSHRRYEQTVEGLSVYGAYAKAAFRANGELVHLIDHLAAVPGTGVRAANIGARDAVEAAMRRVHAGVPAQFRALGRNGNVERFDGGAFFHSAPEATEVAIPHADGSLARGWLVQLWTQKKNLLDHVLVSGEGVVLNIERRTASDAYGVFPIDPVRGGQTLVAGPGAGNAESPIGWLGSGTQTTINIVGNNVNAYLDVDANNRADRGGTSVTNGVFNAVANLGASPTTTTNRNVAVQNLFYLNNVIHDILYRHGFNEGAGNFQSNNFGQGGAGNDPVNAEAQDGSGTDNANFATPADGQRPRMQMYLWTGPGATHEVIRGTTIYGAKGADFGTALTTTGLAGTVVLANDGAGASTSDACEALPSSVSGRIVLADRGNCSFKTKAARVAAAGGTGLIVANNTGAWPLVFTMGDDSAVTTRIRIPAVMISQADGALLKNNLGSTTMRKKAVQPLQLDASLDSDIVYHEYCHGLTWRMIGSMSGVMSGAIGEGMADGCAILINGVQGGALDYAYGDKVGEYSSGDAAPGGFGSPIGIRSRPYAGYSSYRTYANVTGANGVHFDGEVYAAIVWRLLELFGAGERDKLFAYVVDGMNYTAAAPKFETMRDGILSGMAASGAAPADVCKVWTAFAELGVGVGASSTVTSTAIVTVPSFIKPGGC